MIDDSGNTLGATTTATAINCNSTGICTVVDSQSYAAGQWVFLGTSGISPACIGTLNSEGYYGTGNRIYQVLSAGLSSTQFEVQTNGCISTSGTGGTVEDASYFMPVQTAAGPAFKNVNAWYLRNGVDSASIYGGMTGLVEEQATNFSAMYGDLLPSVTGKPLYLLEESAGINDIAVNVTESVIEASFQSFWCRAKSDSTAFKRYHNSRPKHLAHCPREERKQCSLWPVLGLRWRGYESFWFFWQSSFNAADFFSKSSMECGSGSGWDFWFHTFKLQRFNRLRGTGRYKLLYRF
jgi:hypothetical protein